MTIDIVQLAKDRRDWVEVTRRNGFREGISDLLAHQYAEKTHFVYELLQNAEDARATEAEFIISDRQLTFIHNGSRLFSSEDVESITSIGQTTKRSDFTQIGKHGIGFKAVFAYTHTPRIHSGKFHFDIVDVVVPEFLKAGSDPERYKEGETWIILPFDSDEISQQHRFRPLVSAESALADISIAVQQLSIRTLLFLRNIREIRWTLPDGRKGNFIRDTRAIPGKSNARYVDVYDGGQFETWLVFERHADISDDGRIIPAVVEVAFLIRNDTIVPATRTELTVFFPTGKKSGLGFLIQGPFRTTKARDNIKNSDPANDQLLKEAAELAASSLECCRDLGVLTLDSYGALPFQAPDDSFFVPVFETIKTKLSTETLLPGSEGIFVRATEAKLARGTGITDVFAAKDLGLLLSRPTQAFWLDTNITLDRMPELRRYLMNELGIEELDPEKLARAMNEAFLKGHSDDWFARFYEFLLNQEALWRPARDRYTPAGILRSKSILRLEDGSLVPPFNASGYPNAYLPIGPGYTKKVVRTSITAHKPALEFLQRLGLTKPDAVAEVITNVLPKYRNEDLDITENEYGRDLELIFAALGTDSQKQRDHLIDEAQRTPFIRALNAADGKPRLVKPTEAYMPTDEINLYFQGNPAAWMADQGFSGHYRQQSILLGIAETVKVRCRKPSIPGLPISLENFWGQHKQSLKGFDPDADIDGLEFALTHPTPERSRFVWNRLLMPNLHLLKGVVQKSKYQDYRNSTLIDCISPMGETARKAQWVVGTDGSFHRPADLYLSDLPDQYERNEDLARQLGMPISDTPEAIEILAKEYSTTAQLLKELLEFARENPEQAKKLIQQEHQRKNARPAFPVRTTGDRERRKEKVKKQLVDSPEKTYEPRMRSVRVTQATSYTREWLKNLYTNNEGQMVCQICEEEMPFVKRNGEYYFEAVEALSGRFFTKEHEAQFLALCPVCAAKYAEFVKQDDAAMESLKSALIEANQPVVELPLGPVRRTIRLVEIHLEDIKTILEAD